VKAFVVTLDAITALTFMFIAAILLYSYTFQSYALKETYLKFYTFDVLTIMEKTDMFADAIEGNSTNLRRLLSNNTPDMVCMQILISDINDEQVVVISKMGCGEYGNSLQVATIPFVHENQMYLVKAESWYRRE